jgi:YD repeat-containing protein
MSTSTHLPFLQSHYLAASSQNFQQRVKPRSIHCHVYNSKFAFGNSGANNNGNVYRLDHFVPGDESASAWSMSLDYYGYDALNRITGIWENKQSDTQGETSTGLTQQYLYDRYGNRTVNNAVSNFPGIFNAPFNVDQTTNRLLAPNGTISYDAVGNQVHDGYTGAGTRTYDANNKLVSATMSGGTASYLYDAKGSRVSRTVNGVTTWQIYGLDSVGFDEHTVD